MRVRYFLYRNRDYCGGWIVRYLPSPFGDYAEIVSDAGATMFLYRHAVEGWEPLWER
jgi:hypothetical protein